MDLSSIINELAIKYKLPKAQIEHIAHAQFSFVQKIITEGEFKTVMLPNLGKFMVKQHRRALIEANKNGENTILRSNKDETK